MYKRDLYSPAIIHNSIRTRQSSLSPPQNNQENGLMESLKEYNNHYLDPLCNVETTRKLDQKSIPYAVYSKSKSPFIHKDTLTTLELLAQLQLLVDSVFDCQGDIIPDLQMQTQKLILRLEEKFKILLRNGKENRLNTSSDQKLFSIETQSHLKQQVFQLQKELDHVVILLRLREEESEQDKLKFQAIYLQNSQKDQSILENRFKELQNTLNDHKIQIMKLLKEKDNNERDQVSLENSIQELQNTLYEYKTQIVKLMKDKDNSQKDQGSLENRLKELYNTLNEYKTQIVKLLKEKDEYEQEVSRNQATSRQNFKKSIQSSQNVERRHEKSQQKDQINLGDTLKRLENRLSQMQDQDDSVKVYELLQLNQMLSDKVEKYEKYIQQLEGRQSNSKYNKSEGDDQYKKIQRLKEKLVKEKVKREEIESEYEHQVSKLKRTLQESNNYRDLSPSRVITTKSDYVKINDFQQDNHLLQLKLSEMKNKLQTYKEKISQIEQEKRYIENQLQDMKTKFIISEKEKDFIQQQFNQKLKEKKIVTSPLNKSNTNYEELQLQINEHKQRESLNISEIKILTKEINNLKQENQDLRFEVSHQDKNHDEGDQTHKLLIKLEQAQSQIEGLKNNNFQLKKIHHVPSIENFFQDIRGILEKQQNMNIESIMDKLDSLEQQLSLYNSNLVVSRSIPTHQTELSPRDRENVYSFNPNQ